LSNLNIAADVGNYTLDLKTFPVVVTDGMAHVRFTQHQNATTISSLELTTALNPPDSQWSLSSGDNFDSTSIDTSKWGVYSGSGNAGVGIRDPNNVKVHDGELELQGTNGYNGSGVAMRLNQTYGRVVVRAKVDKGNGYGPAILMWPQSEKWPVDGEIDMAELPKGERDTSHFTLHWGTNNSQESTSTKGDFSGWHTWNLEWQPDHISEWIDGQLIKTTTNDPAIPKGPMHLALQQDVGADGHWIPGTDANTPPVVSLHVAYAAVFQNDMSRDRSLDGTAPVKPPLAGSVMVSGPIKKKAQQLGSSVTGPAVDREFQLPSRLGEAGSWQPFTNGIIFNSPATGAHYVPNGLLRNAYFNQCAFFCGGLPTADVTTTVDGKFKKLVLQNGELFQSLQATLLARCGSYSDRSLPNMSHWAV